MCVHDKLKFWASQSTLHLPTLAWCTEHELETITIMAPLYCFYYISLGFHRLVLSHLLTIPELCSWVYVLWRSQTWTASPLSTEHDLHGDQWCLSFKLFIIGTEQNSLLCDATFICALPMCGYYDQMGIRVYWTEYWDIWLMELFIRIIKNYWFPFNVSTGSTLQTIKGSLWDNTGQSELVLVSLSMSAGCLQAWGDWLHPELSQPNQCSYWNEYLDDCISPCSMFSL